MGTTLMATKKNRRSEASMEIAKAIMEQYQPKSVEEMQAASKISSAQCLKQSCKAKWMPTWAMWQTTMAIKIHFPSSLRDGQLLGLSRPLI